LWPVFLVLPMLFQPEQAKTEMMQQLSIALASPEAAGWIIVISFAAASFLGGSNGTTSTSISREGQELYVKKYLPVSYRQQLTAKVLSGFVLGLAAVIMMVLFAVLGLKLSPWLGLLILATAWLPVLLTSLTGIIIDLYNPKLDWDNEQKAVKQNMNVLYNMAAGVIPAVLTIAAKAALPGLSSLIATTILLTAVYGLLCLFLFKLLFTLGVKRFCRLEG
jgi:ABC-2 type transport system permease protein